MNWLQILKNSLKEQEAIFKLAKDEKRNCTPEEVEKIDKLTNDMKNAKKHIEIENGIKINSEFVNGLEVVDNKGKAPTIEVKKNKDMWDYEGQVFKQICDYTVSPTQSMPDKLHNAIEGANTVTPSEGGFLVENELMPGLDKKTWETSDFASKCSKKEIGKNFNGLTRNVLVEDSRVSGSRYGGISISWIGEGGTIPATNPEIEQRTTKLKKAVGACYLTEEQIQDGVALYSSIKEDYPKEMAYSIDEGILTGNGNAEMQGIFNSSSIIEVAKEGSQPADMIIYENVQKIYNRCRAMNRKSAIWVTNQDCEIQLQNMDFPGDSSPVYMPPGGLSASPYATLFGLPVHVSEHAETLGDSGDISLIDFSAYELIQKGGLRIDESIHVQFLTDQRLLRFIKRVGGQPMWKLPITPAKGANTLSYAVKLAERA